MIPESVEELPKVLQVTLAELMSGQDLIHWSVNSNKSITSVTIRFALPGHLEYTPVTWRKSPAQFRRDNARFNQYSQERYSVHHEGSITMQQNSPQEEHLNDIQNVKVCEDIRLQPFYQSPICTPQTGTADGQVCGDPVLSHTHKQSESEINMSTLEVEEAEHTNVNKHDMTISDDHKYSDAGNVDNNDTLDTDDNSDDTPPQKIDLNGTIDDFVKIVSDWRQCEKHAFVRGLVKDGRITEIELGSKGPLKVIDKQSADPEEYKDQFSFIETHRDLNGNFSIWKETGVSMFALWKEYLMDLGEIT